MAVNAEVTGARVRAASAAAPPKLVLVSSLSVAGPRTASRPAREDDPPAPVNGYGESKLLGEELLRRKGAGVRWTIVRPPWVYGPGDRATLALFRLAARGFFPSVRGAGIRRHCGILSRRWCWPEIRREQRTSHYAAGRSPSFGPGAAACGGDICVPGSFSLMGLAGEAGAWLTRRAPLLGRDKACEGLQPGWVCDDSRIRAELGYRSRVGLEDGVAGTLAWYRTRGWL
jgi:nucleoside-diphosphate-sugar epimerase